jgi:hypothetical protein
MKKIIGLFIFLLSTVSFAKSNPCLENWNKIKPKNHNFHSSVLVSIQETSSLCGLTIKNKDKTMEEVIFSKDKERSILPNNANISAKNCIYRLPVDHEWDHCIPGTFKKLATYTKESISSIKH